MRMRLVAYVWGRKNAYKILVRKSEGKTPLEKPKRRWEDKNKIDVKGAFNYVL